MICIAVDDIGLHEGIHLAASALVDAGRVHALGCMVGGAAWRDASGWLRRLDVGAVDTGLHLDLTEWPLLRGPRHSLGGLIRDSHLGRLDAVAVRSEIRAQLDAFEVAVGRAPAYVDGHRHVHQLPIVRHALMAELALRYPSPGPWLRATRRVTDAGLLRALGGRTAAFKPWLIERLGADGLARLARDGGRLQNGRLLGIYDFTGGAPRYRVLLAQWLRAARSGDLLMCHPSLPADVHDSLLAARVAEFDVLASREFAALLHDAGIALQPMSLWLARLTAGPPRT